jgi:urease accessory protein
VVKRDAPFEPESGAYGGGHRHGHDATFEEDHALAKRSFEKRWPEPEAAPPRTRERHAHDHSHPHSAAHAHSHAHPDEHPHPKGETATGPLDKDAST